MILLLGATGYIGQAFGRELRRRGECFIPLSRRAFDYSRFDLLFDYVRRIRPQFVINAAAYTGRPNMDDCEVQRMATFQANTLLPQTIARVCSMTNTPFGHVSSGCIYSGAKVFENGQLRVEKDIGRNGVRKLFETHPERFLGFTELDEPNATFRNGPCSFIAGTKALAEESLRSSARTFIWRARLPFNETDASCNFLTKLQTYPQVLDHITSLTHVDDFARVCLDLYEKDAPYGIYNVVNPGAVTTRQVVEMIQDILRVSRPFRFWSSLDEFYQDGTRAPRSVCILDTTKLLSTGVKLRPLREALQDALNHWQAEPGDAVLFQPLAVQMAG